MIQADQNNLTLSYAGVLLRVNVCSAYLRPGDLAPAHGLLDPVTRSRPDVNTADAHVLLGAVELREGHVRAALERCRAADAQVRNRNTNWAEGVPGHAEVELWAGHLDAALDLLREALDVAYPPRPSTSARRCSACTPGRSPIDSTDRRDRSAAPDRHSAPARPAGTRGHRPVRTEPTPRRHPGHDTPLACRARTHRRHRHHRILGRGCRRVRPAQSGPTTRRTAGGGPRRSPSGRARAPSPRGSSNAPRPMRAPTYRSRRRSRRRWQARRPSRPRLRRRDGSVQRKIPLGAVLGNRRIRHAGGGGDAFPDVRHTATYRQRGRGLRAR